MLRINTIRKCKCNGVKIGGVFMPHLFLYYEHTEQQQSELGGKMMMGLFGDLFDFNHDGKMDAFERATEFSFIEELEQEDSFDSDETEFELSGLDADELELMDSNERREVLEEAGLDPDDYDF